MQSGRQIITREGTPLADVSELARPCQLVNVTFGTSDRVEHPIVTIGRLRLFP